MLKRIRLVSFLAIAAAGITACIFDSGGDYNGGGRRDIGASLNQGEEEPPLEEDGGGGTSSGAQDSGGNPLADALGGGASG